MSQLLEKIKEKASDAVSAIRGTPNTDSGGSGRSGGDVKANEFPSVTAATQSLLPHGGHDTSSSSYGATSVTGCPFADITHSLNIGGHVLASDTMLMEKQQTFNRNKIVERMVHPCGAGAIGHFEVTRDVKDLTCASFLSNVGKKTPVFGRFSTTTFGREFPDQGRNPRGFALKFYTDDGNYDMAGLHFPIFFVRDPSLGPDLMRSQQRNPSNFLLDLDALFDFLAGVPESLHCATMMFSDYGTPVGFRQMNAFGCHTFKWVTHDGKETFVKYHFVSENGISNFSWPEAIRVCGEDPDFAKRDLYSHIEKGGTASWRFHVQTMTHDQIDALDFDPFDVTKVWPHSQFPLREVGRLVFDKNPESYHRDVEQVAFSPGSLVRGIELSPDPLLQWRSFFYRDTQYYRLGVNLHQIPINCPLHATMVHPISRDGRLRSDANGAGDPQYALNYRNVPSIGDRSYDTRPVNVGVNGYITRGRAYKGKAATSAINNDGTQKDTSNDQDMDPEEEYRQVRRLYRHVMSDKQRDHLYFNIADQLKLCRVEVRYRFLAAIYKIDPEYAAGVITKMDTSSGNDATTTRMDMKEVARLAQRMPGHRPFDGCPVAPTHISTAHVKKSSTSEVTRTSTETRTSPGADTALKVTDTTASGPHGGVTQLPRHGESVSDTRTAADKDAIAAGASPLIDDSSLSKGLSGIGAAVTAAASGALAAGERLVYGTDASHQQSRAPQSSSDTHQQLRGPALPSQSLQSKSQQVEPQPHAQGQQSPHYRHDDQPSQRQQQQLYGSEQRSREVSPEKKYAGAAAGEQSSQTRGGSRDTRSDRDKELMIVAPIAVPQQLRTNAPLASTGQQQQVQQQYQPKQQQQLPQQQPPQQYVRPHYPRELRSSGGLQKGGDRVTYDPYGRYDERQEASPPKSSSSASYTAYDTQRPQSQQQQLYQPYAQQRLPQQQQQQQQSQPLPSYDVYDQYSGTSHDKNRSGYGSGQGSGEGSGQKRYMHDQSPPRHELGTGAYSVTQRQLPQLPSFDNAYDTGDRQRSYDSDYGYRSQASRYDPPSSSYAASEPREYRVTGGGSYTVGGVPPLPSFSLARDEHDRYYGGYRGIAPLSSSSVGGGASSYRGPYYGGNVHDHDHTRQMDQSYPLSTTAFVHEIEHARGTLQHHFRDDNYHGRASAARGPSSGAYTYSPYDRDGGAYGELRGSGSGTGGGNYASYRPRSPMHVHHLRFG